jgi:hypothetical protein
MPSVISAEIMLGKFLLGCWNPFEFVVAMTLTKHVRFYVERRKKYLHGINGRNVVEPVFSRLIVLPRFPDTLDVLPSCDLQSQKRQ